MYIYGCGNIISSNFFFRIKNVYYKQALGEKFLYTKNSSKIAKCEINNIDFFNIKNFYLMED